MLDTDTKRRIDTARDILVGKVPDPKSQVEQITIALIYKFMDDMDAEAEELGGKRKFFAGDYARYGWAKLMRSGLGGHETLNLYAEAIAKMPENPGIPPLFRDIFKNAYLPYRDPETLRAFLKIVDEFTYDHSERLGDAFEYLLSVLGSQGDAGQFRTPRHIIDFIVAIVDPKKTETVLDPACGTAGFLISSYKHILKANVDDKGHSTLTPDDKGRLAQNFKGYDISPDMVRLSLVNLYLHGFTDPHIAEYDTLTSQDKWNEHADVILANPPFMSPKGGIKPHNRFSVQSKRSEVLFVDYMAEHLTPGGRAGIIVPEGIIFQSQTAYTQLRKMLVEEYLVAVVSLPTGVFNPYSGVKTSILILDKSLAKQAQTIAFFKVENDGFGLGAQRREIEKNDLPQARVEIAEYLRRLRARESVEGFQPTLGLVVPKEKIAANGDYNLSGERYRESAKRESQFPHLSLSDIAEVRMGETLIKGDLTGTGKPIFSADTSDQPWAFSEPTRLSFGRSTLVIGARGTIGSVKFPNRESFTCTQTTIAITADTGRVKTEFLYHWLKAFDFTKITEGVGIPMITVANVNRIQMPLPPLDVQKEIVAEIEGYQKVIDGARAVLDNYRPHIPIHPDWPMVELGEVLRKSEACVLPESLPGPVTYVGLENISQGTGEVCGNIVSNNPAEIKSLKSVFRPGEILYGKLRPNLNKVWLADREGICSTDIFVIQPLGDRVVTAFYENVLRSESFNAAVMSHIKGAQLPRVGWSSFALIRIPLPSLEAQRAIVAEIEAEQSLVAANRELIARFEKKIQATLARVWGEEAEPTPAEEA
jgi:type I restriction enzyme M protein